MKMYVQTMELPSGEGGKEQIADTYNNMNKPQKH